MYNILWLLSNEKDKLMKEKKEENNYNQDETLFTIMSAITYYRTKNNLSQEEFAKKIHMDRAFISKMECRKANPSLQTLLKLADAMDAKLEILFKF